MFSRNYFFVPYLKCSLKWTISDVFLTHCLPIAFRPTSAFLFTSEREIIFPQICSKFAIECDWNSKNSQNNQNLGFFEKIDVFSKKNPETFQNGYMLQIFSRMYLKSSNGFFLKNVFPSYFWGFFGKGQKKIKVGEVRKYEETGYFEKKNAFILLKGIFNNVGRRKISRR